MTRSAIVPLTSARFVEYAMPVPCFVCGAQNGFKAEHCACCSAPMALAQAERPKVLTHLVAAVGPTGVGKTVYLGMLMDMLSRLPEQVQVLARGAFSITLQELTIRALTQREFPERTPGDPKFWNWVHCQVKFTQRKGPLELVMPDMAGEAVLSEAAHPNSVPIVRPFLVRSHGAMVFIDAPQLKAGRLDQGFSAGKLLACLSEVGSGSKHGWLARPVALVLTKADRCEECLEDPAAFARTHAAELWRQCTQRFGCHRFFAVGVAGACAYRHLRQGGLAEVPLRIEPHGVLEPFEWLMERIADG